MATVDNRIVHMKFDNSSFERGASQTMSTLERLKRSLQFGNSANSIKEVGAAAKNVSFDEMSRGADEASNRLSMLKIVGTTALVNLANSAVNAGKSLVKSVLGPLTSGGWNRASNIEAAKFKLEGLGVVGKDLEAVWQNVTDAVDGTAYSLDSAALVAAQMAASGMRGGDEMARSLRAISGVASVTGSSYDDIGRIFTQVAGQGKVMGDQLLQLSGRGMNAAATLAKELGKSEAEVRDMVSKGKIDFQTFADAMNHAFGDAAMKANQSLSGAMANTKSALAKIGAMFIEPFITNTTTEGHVSNLVELFNALRKAINTVKDAMAPFRDTLVQPLLSVIQAITRGLESFEKLTSPIKEVQKQTEKSTQTVKTWRESLLQTAVNLQSGFLKPLNAISKGIGDAFGKTGIKLMESFAQIITKVAGFLEKLTAKFVLTDKAAKNISTIVTKLVEIFIKLSQVIAPIVGVIGKVAGALFDIFAAIAGAGLDIAANGLSRVTVVLSGFLDVILLGIHWLKEFATQFKTALTDGVNNAELSGFESLKEAFETTFRFIDMKIKEFKESCKDGVRSIPDMVKTIAANVIGALKDISGFLQNTLGHFKIEDLFPWLDALNKAAVSGGIGAVLKMIKDFLSDFNKATSEQMSVKPFTDAIDQLTESMKGMTKSIKIANVIMFSVAVGILADAFAKIGGLSMEGLAVGVGGMTAVIGEMLGAMWLMGRIDIKKASQGAGAVEKLGRGLNQAASALEKLGKLDWEQLGRGLVGLGGVLLELIAACKLLNNNKFIKDVNKFEFTAICTNLILLGEAIKVLVGVVKSMSKLNWDELSRGLVGVGAILLEVATFMRLVNGVKVKISSGFALIEVSLVIAILSQVAKSLAKLDVEGLKRGLTAVGVLLAEVAAFGKLTDGVKIKVTSATGILIISAAMVVLGEAVKNVSGLSWEETAKGLTVIAGGMIAISASANLLPKGLITKATGVVIIAEALKIVGEAVKSVSTMSWEEIGKGLTVIAGSLVAITGACVLLPKGMITKAAGIIVIAQALSIISEVVKSTASLSWEEIGKGMTVIAGGLLAIVAASHLLPKNMIAKAAGVIVMAEAITIVSDAVLKTSAMSWEEIGKGMTVVAGGLTLLALASLAMNKSLAGAFAVLTMSGALAILTPCIVALSKISWKSLLKALLTLAGAFIVLGAAAGLLAPLAPAIIALSASLAMCGAGIVQFSAGVALLSVLGPSACAAITGALIGVAEALPVLMAKFAEGLVQMAQIIADNSPIIITAIKNLLLDLMDAIIELTPKLIATALTMLEGFIAAFITAVPMLVDAGMRLIAGILTGIANNIGKITEKAIEIIVNFVNAIASQLPSIIDAGINLIISFISGLAEGIQGHANEFGTALADLALSGITAMAAALAAGIDVIMRAVKEIADAIWNGLCNLFGGGESADSQSFAQAGTRATEEYANSISQGQVTVQNAGISLAEVAVQGLNSRLSSFQASGKAINDNVAAGIRTSGTVITGAFLQVVTSLVSSINNMAGSFQSSGNNLGTQFNYGLSSTQGVIQSTMSRIIQACHIAITSQYGQFNSAGRMLITRVTNGVTSGAGALRTAFSNAVNQGLNAIKGKNSEFYSAGRALVTQLNNGFSSNTSSFSNACRNIANAGASACREAYSGFYQAGKYLVEGFKNGIVDNTWQAEAKARATAIRALDAAKNALNEHSPSREMYEVGRYFVLGFSNAIGDYEKVSTNQSTHMAEAAKEVVANSMRSLSDLIVDEIDSEPVIRPVVDLSDVKDKASQLRRMFGSNPMASTVNGELESARQARYSSASAPAQAQPTSINFTQNNYSPKALSRLEIYRDTKNQFAQFKKLVTA